MLNSDSAPIAESALIVSRREMFICNSLPPLLHSRQSDIMPYSLARCLHQPKQNVYNSTMRNRKRYTDATHSSQEIARWQNDFFRQAGPSLRLLADLMSNAPGLSLVIKDAKGRIMHTNAFNAHISGWSGVDEMIGYTSEELYPPDQAAVYSGRDREVMETGVPIVERIYGFVADRSTALNCVTVRPVESSSGKRIGTATIYWRAERKLGVANWYDPIRRAIVYLDKHYNETVSVERLAALANYTEVQFRRLFKELTQLTPSEYVMNVRLNAAKTLLSTTDKLITSIAAETGFYDHAHFIRSFRTATGQTPAAYRRQLRHVASS